MKTNRKALQWIIYSILFITGLFGVNSAGAQTIHPVTASLQLVPPYSVYLADYAAPGNDKLRVILTLNDLSQPSYTVRLRLKVELNGRVIMQTDPVYRGSAITLMPGMPQIITGSQLNEYLVSDHLQFMNGFSRENYERTKALPEGAYRICVTAYDLNRSDDVAISNDGCNIFFFQKNEAPLLNFPLCNSRVDRKDPQFLSFTWSIRNTPSFVTGSSGTGYRFELFEVRPAGSNPEYIVRSSTPIYTANIDNAMLLYGPGEPRLQDSMQYVWRVQAYDKDGRDAYQNNGYSQACVFTYGGLDPFVVNNIGKPELLGEALGERSGKWWWHISNAKTVDGWNLQYRKHDTTGSKNDAFDWNKQYLTDTLFHLFNLEPDNTYEARVQPVVRGIAGSYSETVLFRTLPKRVYECGKDDAANNGDTGVFKPLNSAIAGMIVRVGDFDMQLLEVSGGNGRFSGYGAITTPLLGMKLNVKFTDVTINDKLRLTQGEAIALTEGIEKWVKDQKQYYRGGDDVGKVVDGDIEPSIITELKIFSENDIRYDSANHTITITGNGGQETKIIDVKDKTLPIVIEDGEGELYQVSKDGKVQKLGKRNSSFTAANSTESLNKLQTDKGKVTFSPIQGNSYAFDSWKDAYSGKPVLEDSYEKLADGAYRVPVKAMVPEATEDVQATLQIIDNNSIKVEKLQFITGKGIAYPFKRNGNTFTITVTGGAAGDAQELYAVYPTDSTHYLSLGKLLIVSYAAKNHKVVLIPVGDVTINKQNVTEQLNSVFKPIGITYEVVTDESYRQNKAWDVVNNNGVLDITPSALFSNGATGEMKELIKTYSKGRTIDKHTAYIFLLNESSKATLLGEMARGEQFGYVFTKGADDKKISRTIAHELGHGRYKLEHTFNGNIGLTEGSTDNLMDNTDGAALIKYQWDAIHDPGVVWGALESDGEGESDHVNIEALLKWISDNKGKKAQFRRNDFFLNNQRERAWVDVPLYFTHDSKQFVVYAETYADGEVDFEMGDNKTYSAFGVRIDENARFHTGFRLSVRYSGSSNNAFTIWAKTYEDYEALLKKISISLTDSKRKSFVKTYKEALNAAGNNCNKLDKVYENMPPFVIDSLRNSKSVTDDDRWRQLQSLVNCSVDKEDATAGTDENKSILNLLAGFNNAYLYLKVTSDREFFKKLVSKFEAEYMGELAVVFSSVGGDYWTEAQMDNAPRFPLYETQATDGWFEPGDALKSGSIRYIVGCSTFDGNNGYTFGAHSYLKDKSDRLIEPPGECRSTPCTYFDPVKVETDEYECYVPAFFAHEQANRIKGDNRRKIAAELLSGMLPEAPHLTLKVNRWFKLIRAKGAKSAAEEAAAARGGAEAASGGQTATDAASNGGRPATQNPGQTTTQGQPATQNPAGTPGQPTSQGSSPAPGQTTTQGQPATQNPAGTSGQPTPQSPSSTPGQTTTPRTGTEGQPVKQNTSSSGESGRTNEGAQNGDGTGLGNGGKVLPKKIGTIDPAIKEVAPHLEELTELGIDIKLISEKDAEDLLKIKADNDIRPTVNVQKLEVQMENGESYTRYATSGYPSESSKNILTKPSGAPHPQKENSVFLPHASHWEGLDRFNDTDIKLLEEFAKSHGAKPNVSNQVFPDVRGKVKLIGQLCPCGSCTNVIKVFVQMYPGMEFEIYNLALKKFK